MRILVISDTHGYTKEVIEAAKNIEKLDMLFHLGDYVEDGVKISKELGLESLVVRGNGDYHHMEYNNDEILEIKGKKIMLTHGHNYNVSYNLQGIYYKALEMNVDLILFGHTHIPVNEREGSLIIMNPGSASFPRGFKKDKTFGIIDIGESISTKIIKIN